MHLTIIIFLLLYRLIVAKNILRVAIRLAGFCGLANGNWLERSRRGKFNNIASDKRIL